LGFFLQDAINKGWFRKAPISREQPPDFDKIIDTALEISSGMAFLHARGVVHGDLTGAYASTLANIIDIYLPST
jgi:tRNA A-37 threonylcarbamoyl transferase component Bud32